MIEKNNDNNNALLGFTLMGAIMLFWLYLQPPVEESVVDTPQVDSSESVDVIKDSDKPVDLKNSLCFSNSRICDRIFFQLMWFDRM